MAEPPLSSTPSLQPGTLLGETYVVHERLAVGGMGEVYRASHVRMPGGFAIKVLTPRLAGDPEAVARFCREAAIASVLRHPHVVQVLDFDGRDSERPFLVMEHLRGEDLAEHLLARGPLPLRRVVAIVRQISAALEAAHALGIVHRDLKPANVMLVEYQGLSDFVKVLDFGVSRIAGTESGSAARTLLGTPSYMAPEQAAGHADAVDARTDQFALAVLAHVLLTGAQPFAGQTTPEILHRIIHGDPAPLADRVPWPSFGVEQVLARALCKRPGGRFARVSDLSAALARAAANIAGALPPEDSLSRYETAALQDQDCLVGRSVETVIYMRQPCQRIEAKCESDSETVTIATLAPPATASMAEVA
jgi:serine/threonine protein kinase